MAMNNKGRQKLEMKKLGKENNLQVTFSKRRFGLFKKASELSTLCGAEILMLVCSPGGNVYCFGHPNARGQIDRFSSLGHNSIIRHQQNNVETRPDRNSQFFNGILTQELDNEEKEEHRKKMLEGKREAREQGRNMYEKDVKELDLNETDHMICALQDLEKKLVNEILQRRNTFNYNPNNTPLFGYNTDLTPMFGYNNDGVIVPRSNNDGVDVPSDNMNDMSSDNFNQN